MKINTFTKGNEDSSCEQHTTIKKQISTYETSMNSKLFTKGNEDSSCEQHTTINPSMKCEQYATLKNKNITHKIKYLRMKRIQNIGIVCMVLMTHVAYSKGTIQITGVKTEKKDSLVWVSFDMLIGSNAIKHHRRITPVIKSTGIQSKKLRPLVIESKRVKILHARNHKTEMNKKTSYQNGEIVTYLDSVSYEEWMNGGALAFEYRDSACCKVTSKYTEVKIFHLKLETNETKTPLYAITPSLSSIKKRWNFSKDNLIIYFPVGKTTIDTTVSNNRSVLTELIQVVKHLFHDSASTLSHVNITGFSSPDGSKELNMRLSGMRAKELKSYLQNAIIGLNDSLFGIKNGGENWFELRRMVFESRMQNKNEVLEILDNTLLDDGGTYRKKKLRELKKGVPYQYMMKNMFPKLRNACYVTVWYSAENDKEGEMINQAILFAKDQAYDQALSILQMYKNDSRSWNALGVCLMMTNQLQEAKVYLSKAAKEGYSDAEINLSELAKMDSSM